MRNFTSRQEEKKWNVELAINLRNTETKKKVSEFNFARFDAMEWQHRRASQSGLSCILHGNPIISIHFPPCSAAELQKKIKFLRRSFFFRIALCVEQKIVQKNLIFSHQRSVLFLSLAHSFHLSQRLAHDDESFGFSWEIHKASLMPTTVRAYRSLIPLETVDWTSRVIVCFSNNSLSRRKEKKK